MSSQTETADIAMRESSPDHSYFDEALDAIHTSILEEHRRDFHPHANASLLLDELRTLSAGYGSGDQRLVVCSQKVAHFVQTFAPYFDVLSTCIQLRPVWVGWFWGVVRLLFRIGSDNLLFLEKIADLFETITRITPAYQQIYETCRYNAFGSEDRIEEDPLAVLMSHVYADLVQLCLDLYHVFCRGNQGSGLRHLTLEATHPALWRPLDSRFSRLETRLSHHRRWLENETASQIQNYTEIAQHRNSYVAFLHRQSEANSDGHVELEEYRVAKRIRRVERVKNWLSNSSSPAAFSKRSPRQASSESSAWFFKLPAYRNWKDESFKSTKANDANLLQDTWQHRVLFVQAQAGFGKTFISNTVIDDLAAVTEDLDISDEPSSTAFFHFNRNSSGRDCSADAFRNLACQLLHIYRHDHSTLDAICLLLRKTSCRDKATDGEVLEVLIFLLRQHPTFLVVDGIDESSDVETFLTSLAGICCKSDARVILFSRPSIRIPLEYQKWASDAPHIIVCTREDNAIAIDHFVAQDMNRMADQGFFGISMDRTLIPQVARTANGSFVWANMLLKFFQSPILSSDERHALLGNIRSLEGLDSLYRNILSALERRSQHEKCVIADTFRWLSSSINCLSSSSLRATLSTFDYEPPEETHTTDIMETLPELACGLLHIENNTISFTHDSIRDYLQSPGSQDSEFNLQDESSVHAHLASRCISYLAHDVPKRPLSGLRTPSPPILPTIPTSSGASLRTSKSGDSGYKSLSSSEGDTNPLLHPIIQSHHKNPSTTSIRSIPFDTHLPFLRYAALCWPIHLSRALSLQHDAHDLSSPSPAASAFPYLPTLSAFLSSRLAVTAWVEASFRYNLPPTLTRLVGPLSDLKGEIPPTTTEGRQLRQVLHELRELSDNLVELKRQHEGVLRENPSLIWQMESAGEEAYWPVWEVGRSGNRNGNW